MTTSTPSMRQRFVEVTAELLAESTHVVVVLADIGVDRFASAARRHPDRIINVGIREQLMIGVAGGLALEGFRPIVHSYAPFVVERPHEQLKVALGHQGVGAVVVSVGASYDWAAGGRTHHAPGDVAALDALGGWQVHVPGHAGEVGPILRRAVAGSGRVYVRLSEQSNDRPRSVAPGGMSVERKGSHGSPLVVAVGPMLDRVLAATSHRDATVLYAPTVRPFDRSAIERHLTGTALVLVEPYLQGTSAAEISHALRYRPHRLLAIGVGHGELRRYGSPEEHDRAHCLDVGSLRHRIDTFLADRSLRRPHRHGWLGYAV